MCSESVGLEDSTHPTRTAISKKNTIESVGLEDSTHPTTAISKGNANEMIAVTNLVKRHGNLEVLRGVSMNVNRGEVAAIIGPSGGGKSTLLRCINGLERFQEGEVQVENMKLSSNPDGEALRKLRQRVGMVFQQFHLFPHMTVLENVMAGPRIVLKYAQTGGANRHQFA